MRAALRRGCRGPLTRSGGSGRAAAIALLALVAMLLACDEPISYDGPTASWPVYGGDAGGSRHSPLTQITRDNVDLLEVAWTFHTGDVLDGTTTKGKSAFQNTPVLLDDTLYVCSPKNRVFALDPETGAQKWVFDPGIQTEGVWNFACRGVAAWEDPSAREGQQCAQRIFLGSVDGRLFALDAATGRPCMAFADAGMVDLKRGMGPILPGEYGVTSPPTVIGDVVAVGGLVWDGQRTDHAPGVVRGFDVRTGELRWFWDPVPPGTPPLPRSSLGEPQYHHGTPNAWSIFSVDAARDLLFVPTGNAGPDFYGGERHGLDHYSSSVVALRGATGELVWHFQTVHHDLWDYDVSSQPLLIDVTKDGATIPAVVQATKMGHVFLLRPGNGRADLAGRRATGSARRRAGRALFADAAVSRPIRSRCIPRRPSPARRLRPPAVGPQARVASDSPNIATKASSHHRASRDRSNTPASRAESTGAASLSIRRADCS